MNMRLFTIMAAIGCAACGLPQLAAATQGTPPASPAALPMDMAGRLNDLLAAMTKTNDDDFYAAASLVVDAAGDEQDFLRLMTAAADAGSPAARYWLATYLLPTGEKDPAAAARAVGLMEAAAGQGYVPAMVEYACLLSAGVGCGKDQKKAMSVLMDACKQGSQRARAIYLLFTGRLEAGNLELPEIASELKKGNYYLEEILATRQTEAAEAERWLRLADSHGSALAPYALTQLQDLPGVNPQEALSLLQRAAERHHVQAMSLLGMVMMRPDLVQGGNAPSGSREEAQQGMRLLLIATALGDTSVLATMLANGEWETDTPAAGRICSLFRRNYMSGKEDGAGLGYCMATGKGCPQDVEGGLALLEESRRQGTAQWVNQALASLYFNGDGVKADLRKSIDYLGEDAAAGAIHAYAMMAALTALGNSHTPPDLRQAGFYLKMAVEAGDTQARQVYDSILHEGGWRFMPALFRERD